MDLAHARQHGRRERDPDTATDIAHEIKDPGRDKARELAIQKLEEESKKPVAERRPPEYGSAQDFQLQQALNRLKGLAVVVSKTQTERPAEKKE